MIKDSGNRREFEGGSVRDMAEGKGRCDLLPLREVANLDLRMRACADAESWTFLEHIAEFTETLNETCIYEAIEELCCEFGWDFSTAMLEVAVHFEEGARKYDDDNWRKVGGGIPAHCYIDSSIRHYLKHIRGDVDERHDRAAIWNLLCLLYTLRNIPEKDDLSYYRERLAAKARKEE